MSLRLSLFEIFLIELVAWFGLWLLNDFMASLLTLIIGAIVLAVLAIALISEWIEPSRVPRRYFYVMAISFAAPLVAAGLYLLIFGGQFYFYDGR